MKTKISIWWLVVLAIVFFALCKQCEGETKTVTKTVTKVTKVHDTITEVKIDTFYTRVYVERVKTVKGKDSLIYVYKPTDTSIKANQYKTEVKSNDATAKLDITTTGELLDVSGVITYPEKETTTTITKTRDASGLYLYGNTSINSFSSTELGLQFNIKNKAFLSTSVQYNNITNNVDAKIGIGIKIW